MSSTPAHYTDLYPKRDDISGSNYQAFGKGEDVISYVIGGIKAKTIAAIGTVAPGSSIVQYLYAPGIHHDLGGEPNLIVGNASNNLGKFSCLYIPFASLKLFACIAKKEKLNTRPTPIGSSPPNNTCVYYCQTSSSSISAKNHRPGT